LTNGRFAAEDRHLRTLFGVGAVGDLSDGQLLERFATLGGDPAELAFAALVERHGPMVLRVARSVHPEEHDAHDAFQATFFLLARKARSLWVLDTIGPWLHAVACRVAAQHRSSEIRRKRHERNAAGPEAYQPLQPDRDDLGRAIHEEIDRLPERYRSAVVLCHLESLTQHEAARRLGWPVGTLQSRLARGRAKLRERLDRRGLAPTLRAIPPIPAPAALVASTARAASTLHGGGLAAEVIAPAVLAMINATSKGMLMTKLKIGSTILVILGGLLATALSPGNGGAARATVQELSAPARPDKPPTEPATPPAVLEPVEIPPPLDEAREVAPPPIGEPRIDPVAQIKSDPESTLPPPATGRKPDLLIFTDRSNTFRREVLPEIQKLVDKGYPVRWTDIEADPGTARNHTVEGVPTFIVHQAGSGIELGRTSGVQPAAKIAEFYNQSVAGSARDTGTDREKPATSASTKPTIPKPWATAARINVKYSPKEWGIGSGTVILSNTKESIILTSAFHFRLEDWPTIAPKDFRVSVSVDLFDDQLPPEDDPDPNYRVWRPRPAQVQCILKDVAAEVIDYDFERDLALIRIRPGRVLPSSPVVPARWKPSPGMKMYAVGCSRGEGASPWSTKIQSIGTTVRGDLKESPTLPPVPAIRCRFVVDQGRSGGGLFTSDGYLAGVCYHQIEPFNEGQAVYAAPESIYKLLDRNGLSALYQDQSPAEANPTAPGQPARNSAAPRTETPVQVSDQERRLADVERKLDRIIEALKIDSLKDVKGDFEPARKR
jgi:RNA polymerase sigma factor (sigma-70 family)